METLELQAFRAEVDQQADFHVVGFELDDGFEFDHDEFFDEEVHAAGSENFETAGA